MTAHFRSFQSNFLNKDDGQFTYTSTEQKRVEDMLSEEFEKRVEGEEVKNITILRERHAEYLLKNLHHLPKKYAGLDASRTWMCYWAINSMNILAADISEETKTTVVQFLKSCEHPKGGYGGGPGQLAHLAPTYAAVMCLISLQTEEALQSIDRETLFAFLTRMKQPVGNFTMHDDGEIDMRSAYCALSVAAILGLPYEKLSEGVAEWIISCQSYEGGFGGEPMTEAHGGYAFCAVAAMVILNRFRLLDIEALLRWVTRRQMKFEGGFQGRTNKLVDGCYSFWQGSILPLIDGEMAREGKEMPKGLFDARMLEEYVLVGCQVPTGGFRDKPDKNPDLYHTCYVLSGLSIAQKYSIEREGEVLGGSVNRLVPINPVFNVTTESEIFAAKHFFPDAN
ncbi:unnamed protein product [Caenorhabditis auriculariae]|uniref:Protein farnesyltransferase subunit beta n=1 Tax=Caenorhabditis auriculariae TaxID=2777116 RepID=A0A8S1HQI9_9PELO|nr:unnamed protein product [Caenorhabditis auriculariae]